MKKIFTIFLLTIILVNMSACLNKPAPASDNKFTDISNTVSDMEIIPDDRDTFTDVPALGPYLEGTGTKIRLFYNSEGVLVKSEAIDDGTTINNKYYDAYRNGKNAAKQITEFAAKNYPDFKIIGYVYNNAEPFKEIYPIGYYKDSPYIQYFYNEPVDFLLVEPFKTIEDGRLAFEKYLKKREQILSETPVFKWSSVDYTNLKYGANSIVQDKIFTDPSITDWKFGALYDSWTPLPLLDENGNEGIYIAYLLYCKNELIAELVYNYADRSAPLEYLRYASFDEETGTFNPLPTSEYIKAYRLAGETARITGMKWVNKTYVPAA